MRKTIRLLKWIDTDLAEGIIKTAELHGAEMGNNSEIAEEIGEANDELIKAQKSVAKALDVLSQIYNECYDD